MPQEDIERGRVAAGNDVHADYNTDDNNSTDYGCNNRLLGIDVDVEAAQQLLLNVGPGRCALWPGLGLAAAVRRAAQLGAYNAACDTPGTHYLLGEQGAWHTRLTLNSISFGLGWQPQRLLPKGKGQEIQIWIRIGIQIQIQIIKTNINTI